MRKSLHTERTPGSPSGAPRPHQQVLSAQNARAIGQSRGPLQACKTLRYFTSIGDAITLKNASIPLNPTRGSGRKLPSVCHERKVVLSHPSLFFSFSLYMIWAVTPGQLFLITNLKSKDLGTSHGTLPSNLMNQTVSRVGVEMAESGFRQGGGGANVGGGGRGRL